MYITCPSAQSTWVSSEQNLLTESTTCFMHAWCPTRCLQAWCPIRPILVPALQGRQHCCLVEEAGWWCCTLCSWSLPRYPQVMLSIWQPIKIYYSYARNILLSIYYILVIPGIYHTYLILDEIFHGYAKYMTNQKMYTTVMPGKYSDYYQFVIFRLYLVYIKPYLIVYGYAVDMLDQMSFIIFDVYSLY